MLIVLGLGIYVRFLLPVAPAFCFLLAWALRKQLGTTTPAQWTAAGAVVGAILGLGGIPIEGHSLRDLPAFTKEFKDAWRDLPAAIGREIPRPLFLIDTHSMRLRCISTRRRNRTT